MRSFFVVSSLALLALCPAAAPAQNKPKPRPADAQTTRTGCVDQRRERYVLTSTDSMKTETVLRGKAFSDDNFARFVGHKAAVAGELKTEDGREVLHATRIDKVAETCH